MRKTILSAVVILAFASHAFAQSVQSQDDRVRTSTVVPNLHDMASGWNKVSESGGELVAIPYENKTLTVKGSEDYYINTKEVESNTRAFLWVKNNADGSKEEFAMLYGTKNIARGAIKVNGRWYVSKELYFDHGAVNVAGNIGSDVVFDKKDKEKPVQVRFFLETVNGLKEVVFNLQ